MKDGEGYVVPKSKKVETFLRQLGYSEARIVICGPTGKNIGAILCSGELIAELQRKRAEEGQSFRYLAYKQGRDGCSRRWKDMEAPLTEHGLHRREKKREKNKVQRAGGAFVPS